MIAGAAVIVLLALTAVWLLSRPYASEALPTKGPETLAEDSVTTDTSRDAEDTDYSSTALTGRVAFLNVLKSQLGSDGHILGDDAGMYYTEWYVGGAYSGGWNKDTPWCGAFVSWAASQELSYLISFAPFASVENGADSFRDGTNGTWLSANEEPLSGDLIFFDWDEAGDEDYGVPDHVGVVLRLSDGVLHTLEGNSAGLVEECRYDARDPHILGYGVLLWR